MAQWYNVSLVHERLGFDSRQDHNLWAFDRHSSVLNTQEIIYALTTMREISAETILDAKP